MTQLISIAFSILILSQSVGFGISDIFRVGDLLEHSEYHSENYGDSFSDFLAKHYGSLKETHKKNHSEEKQKHEKLPFQDLSCNHSLSVSILTPFFNISQDWRVSLQKKSNYFYINLYSSSEKSNIFQPPKYI